MVVLAIGGGPGDPQTVAVSRGAGRKEETAPFGSGGRVGDRLPGGEVQRGFADTYAEGSVGEAPRSILDSCLEVEGARWYSARSRGAPGEARGSTRSSIDARCRRRALPSNYQTGMQLDMSDSGAGAGVFRADSVH